MKTVNEMKLSNIYIRNFLTILLSGILLIFFVYYEHFTLTMSTVIVLVILFTGWVIKKYIFYASIEFFCI